MLKILPRLLLVAFVHCQSNEDVIALLGRIYGPNQPLATNRVKIQKRNPIVPPILTGSTWDEISPNYLFQLLSKIQERNPIVPPIQTLSTWDEIHPNHPLQRLFKTQGRNPIVSPIQIGSTWDAILSNRPFQRLFKTQGRNPIVPLIQTGSTWDVIPPNRLLDRLFKPGKREGCGWANPNGVDLQKPSTNEYAKFGKIPWMVAILKVEPLYDGPSGKKLMILYVGGGSLIHPSVVLTVAHYATFGKTLKVRAGEWDTQRTTEIYPFQERDVTSVEIHKGFVEGNSFYDIAVLFLDKPMELAPNVGVACLPPARITPRENTRCIATGWGKDKFNREGMYKVTIRKIELPVVTRDNCQAALRRTRLGKHFQLLSSSMCAGGALGKDTCRGDGGASLSCSIDDEQDRYVQSGIVAWGVGCGNHGTPGVYVDVSVLRDWIDDKVIGKGYDPTTYSY